MSLIIGTLTGVAILEPGLASATPAAITVEASPAFVAEFRPVMTPTLPSVHEDHLARSSQIGALLATRIPVKAPPTWAQKTWAFTQCIFGVGVPAGLGWSIVSNPGLLAWFAGRGPLPAGVGGAMAKYFSWIKRVCGYALS